MRSFLAILLYSTGAMCCTGCITAIGPTQSAAKATIAAHRQAIESFDQKRDETQLRAARDLWRQGDVDGCRRAVLSLLSRSPEHRAGRLLLAECLAEQFSPEQALPLLRSLVDEDPADPQAVALLERWTQAETAAQPAIDAMLTADETPLPVAEIITAELITAEESPTADQERPTQFDRSLADGLAELNDAEEPTSERDLTQPWPELAASYKAATGLSADTDAENESGSAAERSLASILEDDADVRPAPRAMPRRSRRTQSTKTTAPSDAAPRKNRQNKQDRHDPHNVLNAAVAALRRGEDARAVDLIREALPLHEDFAPFHCIIGTAYYRQGNYAAAELAYRQAVSLDKRNAVAYFLLGCTLTRLGRSDLAAASLRQASALDAKFDGAALPR